MEKRKKKAEKVNKHDITVFERCWNDVSSFTNARLMEHKKNKYLLNEIKLVIKTINNFKFKQFFKPTKKLNVADPNL